MDLILKAVLIPTIHTTTYNAPEQTEKKDLRVNGKLSPGVFIKEVKNLNVGNEPERPSGPSPREFWIIMDTPKESRGHKPKAYWS